MSEQELNGKLAKWAGFECRFGTVLGSKKADWVIKDNLIMECPNFTQSLDVCFKWLVPKLEGFLTIKIKQLSYGQWLCRIEAGEQIISDNPALALCLAIEKLIDRGKSEQ